MKYGKTKKMTKECPPTKKFKIVLLLSYDGSDFCGWQRQKFTESTVQGKLELALSNLLDEPIKLCGAGRTDAGVHARNQVAHFWTTKNPENYNWVFALNGPLTPDSICVKAVWLAPHDFHAIGSSIKKNYKYIVLNRQLPSAWRRNFLTHIRKPMAVNYLNLVGDLLVGEKDFASFQTSGTEVPHTIREIYFARWQERPGNILEFSISGNGFLRQMVRNIVGTMVYMESNSLKPSWILEVLQQKNRQAAKGTAPAQGLYLDRVIYPREMTNRFVPL